MKIGVPKEIKLQEHRIGLTPETAKLLLESSHQLFIQKNAAKTNKLVLIGWSFVL